MKYARGATLFTPGTARILVMAEMGMFAPPRTRVPVTRKLRFAAAIAWSKPAFTPCSRPSNTNAMTMLPAVRIERTGLRHNPAHTRGMNFMTPKSNWIRTRPRHDRAQRPCTP
jgi:hypothetical protein